MLALAVGHFSFKHIKIRTSQFVNVQGNGVWTIMSCKSFQFDKIFYCGEDLQQIIGEWNLYPCISSFQVCPSCVSSLLTILILNRAWKFSGNISWFLSNRTVTFPELSSNIKHIVWWQLSWRIWEVGGDWKFRHV